MKMELPLKIENIIGSRPYTIDETGMSGSQVICFDDMVSQINIRILLFATEA